MKTLQELQRLEKHLGEEGLPKARKPWSGADVIIAAEEPEKRSSGMFAHDRYVITEYALELSGLMEGLRDAFYAEKRIDGCSKIEFFGRLANAALRCIEQSGHPSARQLYAAVLHEAFAIYEEMEQGLFGCLEMAIGGEILDDHVDPSQKAGYVTNDVTAGFFKKRGILILDY